MRNMNRLCLFYEEVPGCVLTAIVWNSFFLKFVADTEMVSI